MLRTDIEGCWGAAERGRVLAEIADELWRYVARHAVDAPTLTRSLAELTGLSPVALGTLRHLHLVLSDDVAQFMDETLPVLLRRMRPVAPPRTVVERGLVRGRIDWGATTAARARSGGHDPALYAASRAHKHFATPEAIVLLRLLHSLSLSCHMLADFAADGAAGWSRVLGRVDEAVRRALEHAALRTLTDEDMISVPVHIHLAACRRSPNGASRTLARVYGRYHDLIEDPTPAALLDALQQRVLVPLDDDALYELWAVLGAAGVLDATGWALLTADLVGQKAVPFTYRSPDGRAMARLHFGHTPSAWRRHSRYRAVFERYGLAGAVRRPDLIVEVERAGQFRYLLVEVKRTRDPGYIADSIYKVLGYLADFEAVFREQEGTHGMVLLWDGPVSSPSPFTGAGGGQLVLATHHDYRAQLGELIATLAR